MLKFCINFNIGSFKSKETKKINFPQTSQKIPKRRKTVADNDTKQAEKKPPFHEVVIAILAGKHDEVLHELGLGSGNFGSGDYFTITCLAFVASQCHIPEAGRPKLTAALISSVKAYGDDNNICQACAMAIANLGTAELVEEEIEKERDENFPPAERMNDDELENLLALLKAIGELSREQTPKEGE